MITAVSPEMATRGQHSSSQSVSNKASTRAMDGDDDDNKDGRFEIDGVVDGGIVVDGWDVVEGTIDGAIEGVLVGNNDGLWLTDGPMLGENDGGFEMDGAGEKDGLSLGNNDGGVVGIRDGVADGAGLNEGLEDGDAEKEGDVLLCTTVTVFVATSATVLSDERETPSAIANTITITQTAPSRNLAFLCFNNGSCGSRGVANTKSGFSTKKASGITGADS